MSRIDTLYALALRAFLRDKIVLDHSDYMDLPTLLQRDIEQTWIGILQERLYCREVFYDVSRLARLNNVKRRLTFNDTEQAYRDIRRNNDGEGERPMKRVRFEDIMDNDSDDE